MGHDLGLDPTRPEGTLRGGALISTLPSLYTPSQITQYLNCIGFPEEEIFSPTLKNLERLALLHLLTFTFENTEMHYTPGHQMEVTPEGIFRRLVVERKGSYCFGHSAIFLQVLRGLDYRAYAGSARVNLALNESSEPLLTRQSHMVHFVQPFPLESDQNNRTYVVDLWFGGHPPVRPILLSDEDDNTIMGVSPYEWHRLRRYPHPLSSLDKSTPSADRDDFHWAMEYQKRSDGTDTTAPWRILYIFTENECFPEDVEGSSFVMCNKPEGIFWNNILAVKHLSLEQLDDKGSVEATDQFAQYPREDWGGFIWRYIIFGNGVKRQIGGSSVNIETLNSEADRIRALNEFFGLDIPEDSRQHMLGWPPSLDK